LRIVYYISGHGFGHTSRSVELIKAILAAQSKTRITVKTSTPAWMFETIPGNTVDVVSIETDTGITQHDSVSMDERDSLRRAIEFYREFDATADREADALRKCGATIVVGDIPPLAHAAAARAQVPSIAISNFTWDWIYEGYDSFRAEAADVIETIRRAYAHASLALRLPMHGGFAPMASVTVDIPFIARRATLDRADTRRRLGVPNDRPFVLASFGAYGLDAEFQEIARSQHLTVLAPRAQLEGGVLYPDAVAAADVVITKPGYGIVSECVASNTPLLYTSRGRFVEYDVFVAEMPRVLRSRFIPQEDLLAGRWRPYIDALLEQPPPPERARIDGAAVAAKAILDSVLNAGNE
jgi:UDP:flavonoid glycosyltransferase YjiC (YdhE family)